jgi:hypothetical protein
MLWNGSSTRHMSAKDLGAVKAPTIRRSYPCNVIHNADAGLLDRYVQSSKMLHAALLFLMLEAANADLVSPSA